MMSITQKDVPDLAARGDENRWHPIEEGLPEENGSYLVQCRNGKMRVVGLFEIPNSTAKCFHFPYSEHSHSEVIAWRECPKGYQENEQND